MYLINQNNISYLEKRIWDPTTISLPKPFKNEESIDNIDKVPVSKLPNDITVSFGLMAAGFSGILLCAPHALAFLCPGSILLAGIGVGLFWGIVYRLCYLEEMVNISDLPSPDSMIWSLPSVPNKKRSLDKQYKFEIFQEILKSINKQLNITKNYDNNNNNKPLEISEVESNNHIIIKANLNQSMIFKNSFQNNLLNSNIFETKNNMEDSTSIYFHFNKQDLYINSTSFTNIEDITSKEIFDKAINDYASSNCINIPISNDKIIPVQIDVGHFNENSSCL